MIETGIEGKNIKNDIYQNIYQNISMTSIITEITDNMDYKSKALKELKELCKERQIKGISAKSKEKIIKLLEAFDKSLLLTQVTQESIIASRPLSMNFQI